MDTVSKLDATFRRQAGIPLNHAVLDFDSAAHGVNDTSEFDEDTITGALDDAPVVHRDCRIDEVAPHRSLRYDLPHYWQAGCIHTKRARPVSILSK